MIKRKNTSSLTFGIIGLIYITIAAIPLAGWINNIIWLFHIDKFSWSGEQIISVIGTFLVPIGAVHGIYLWF